MTLPGDVTLREGLRVYLRDNGLPDDGGYHDEWVWFKIGPVPVAFPNSESRKAAVPFHDLHHVLTGYGTSMRGEAEIGAWEIANGCSGAALRLNLLAMGFASWWAPRSIYRAFLGGRYSKNLYGGHYGDGDALLARPIEAVRDGLGLTRPTPASRPADWLAFTLWLGAAGAMNLAPLFLVAGALWSVFA